MTTISEIRDAVSLGVSIVGLVSKMPAPGSLDDDSEILRLSKATPPGVETLLLTVEDTLQGIVAQFRRSPTTAIQFVSAVQPTVLEQLRQELLGIRLIQGLYVTGKETVGDARAVEPYVDAIHLDSPHTPARIGGTGVTHDWEISRRICDVVDCPVILAGGLRPDNVKQAVDTVRPYAVDVCTGVRDAAHKLLLNTLEDFISAATASQTRIPRRLAG